MPTRPDSITKLSETLWLSEYPRTSGHAGIWLRDDTRGMNLAMRARSEREAFVEALTYYQAQLLEVEKQHRVLSDAVDAFVRQVRPHDEDCWP